MLDRWSTRQEPSRRGRSRPATRSARPGPPARPPARGAPRCSGRRAPAEVEHAPAAVAQWGRPGMWTGRPLTRDPAPTAVRGRPARPRPEARSPVDAMFTPRPAPRSPAPASTPSATCCTAPRRRYPDKLAVVAGDLRVTYAEFDAAVNRTAHALADRGLAQGRPAGAARRTTAGSSPCSRSPPRKLGVVLVPVNFMLGADEIAFILRHSGADRDGRARTRWRPPRRRRWPRPASTAASAAGSALSGAAPARPAGRTSTTGGRRATTARRTSRSPTTTRCG